MLKSKCTTKNSAFIWRAFQSGGIFLLVITLISYVSGHGILFVLDTSGKNFVEKRYLGLIWLSLPLLCLAERHGIREYSRNLIGRLGGLSPSTILISYFLFRELTCAFGMSTIGGHAQMVRPVLLPILEAQTEKLYGALTANTKEMLAIEASAADNVASFFGQALFIGVSAVLLMQEVLHKSGYSTTPLSLIREAAPCAGIATAIHCLRLLRINRVLRKSIA